MKKALLITVCATAMMMAQRASAIPTKCDEYDYDNCYEIFDDDEGYTHKIHYANDVGGGDEGDLEHYDHLIEETVYNSDGKVVKEYSPYDDYGSYSADNMYQSAAYEYTDGKLTQKTTYKDNGNPAEAYEYTNGKLTQKTTYTNSDNSDSIIQTFVYDGDKLKEKSFTTTGNALWDAGEYMSDDWQDSPLELFTADGTSSGYVRYNSDGNVIEGKINTCCGDYFSAELAYTENGYVKKTGSNFGEDHVQIYVGDGYINQNTWGITDVFYDADGHKIEVEISEAAGDKVSSVKIDGESASYMVLGECTETSNARVSCVSDGTKSSLYLDGKVLYEWEWGGEYDCSPVNVKRQGESLDVSSFENAVQWLKNQSKSTNTEVKNADGSYTIYDKDGNFLGFKGKRIYTIDEVNAVAGKTNTFSIRYR